MSRMLTILTALMLILPSPSRADTRPIVVVFDVETKGLKVNKSDLDGLSDYLASRVAESGLFQVVPRDQLKQRLQGQKQKSFKECYDQTCRIELGRELAAQKTLATKIIKLGSRCSISASIFDLRRATTDAAATAMGKCHMDDLVSLLDQAVVKLTGSGAGPAKPPPKAQALPQQLRPQAKLCPEGDLARCEKQCGLGSAQSCYRLGKIFRVGQSGHGRNDTRAARHYAQACDGEWGAACSELGYMTEKGEGRGPSNEKAFSLYKRACDAGYALGCRNLAVFYDKGTGTPKDQDKATRLYERACAGGDMGGCNGLAFDYEKGTGRPQSFQNALRYYAQACTGGNALGCKNLAVMHENGRGTKVDKRVAGQKYERACQLGNMAGCNGQAVATEYGWHGRADPARAAQLYRKACEGFSWRACKNLAVMYENGKGVAKNLARARNLYKSACDHNNADGCNGYAFATERGWGDGNKDLRGAATYYRKACDLRSSTGCSNMGIFYQNGMGVTRDKTQARKFFDKACRMGLQKACTSLKNLGR